MNNEQPNYREFWENVAESSLHLKMHHPATSDQTYRKLVERFFKKWINTNHTKNILKLDAYNEATHTNYTCYFLEKNKRHIRRNIIKNPKKAINKMKRDGYQAIIHPVQCDFRKLPFRDNSFDAYTRELMQSEILNLWEKVRKTIIFVTHSIDEAIFMSDRIAVFSHRPTRVLEVIETQFKRPRNEDLRTSNAYIELRSHIWNKLKH